MVFKLVRTDSEDPCKIQLPVGVHVFGRGVFLDCEDKRVSRKHGLLEVTDDTVTLNALHQNPCFFIRKGSEETEILREGSKASLSNGDKFGLLPNSYWYELLHCTLSPDMTTKPLENVPNVNNNEVQNGKTNEDNSAVRYNSRDGLANEELEESALVDFQLNDTIDNIPRPESPSLITANQASTENQSSTSQTQDYQVDSTPQVSTPSKRAHSTSEPDEVKRIKTEPLDTSAGASDGNAQAGPSNPDQKVKDEPPPSPVKPPNNQRPSRERCWYGAQCYRYGIAKSHACNACVQVKDEPPPSPVKPPNNPGPSQKRCWYGAQCYRKNPQHKADFSHPSDDDWGLGPRAPCPFGAGCQKRDPRHWRDHDHPSTATPPPRPGRGKNPRVKKRKQSDSECSEDSGLSPALDANLPAKRARKPVRRPSYSGSESQNEYDLEDPFMTDDEDDWQPPTSQSQSRDD